MATCPKCGGYLSEGHRCSGDWWRTMRTLVVALGGALFGAVTLLTVVDQPSTVLLAVTGLLGAVLTTALWRVVGF